MRKAGITDAVVVGEGCQDPIAAKFSFVKEAHRQYAAYRRIHESRIRSIRKETALNFKKLVELAQPDDSLALLMYGSPIPMLSLQLWRWREIVSRQKGLSKSSVISTEPLIMASKH